MKLTLTAPWTQPAPGVDRLAIGGYTAVVERVLRNLFPGDVVGVYQYTVLHDHFAIIAQGHRQDRSGARLAVEDVIRNHAQSAQADVNAAAREAVSA